MIAVGCSAGGCKPVLNLIADPAFIIGSILFLIGLVVLGNVLWRRRERGRVHNRYDFDDHGRIVKITPPPDRRPRG